jgi:hypothetical protein
MFYNEKYIGFRCELRFNNPDFHKIKNLLISILGEPQACGLLHPFMLVGLDREQDGEGYQIELTPGNLEILHKKCVEMNISFEEVFERDWQHYHIQCSIGDDEHEGIAYEHEDYWDIYYEDGSLDELPGLRENDFYIEKINKKDIKKSVSKEIDLVFKKWVKANIRGKTL